MELRTVTELGALMLSKLGRKISDNIGAVNGKKIIRAIVESKDFAEYEKDAPDFITAVYNCLDAYASVSSISILLENIKTGQKKKPRGQVEVLTGKDAHDFLMQLMEKRHKE
jgi:hypothetical protein